MTENRISVIFFFNYASLYTVYVNVATFCILNDELVHLAVDMQWRKAYNPLQGSTGSPLISEDTLSLPYNSVG